MANDGNQRKEQKPQSERTIKTTINESIKKGSGDAGGYKRSKSGNASDSTNNTGPRKNG